MSQKLSEKLMSALRAQGNEYGFIGWSDELEGIIDDVRALEEERDTLKDELDWLKANLKSAGQVIGLAVTTKQGALKDRLAAALQREDTLRQLNDELQAEIYRLKNLLEAKKYGAP